ncbi:MAG: hypothetical protein DRN12_04495 [Thermoplasmata archaeon]|nr:MAG: hypothetical protein DRN12_04495 [Thermoplasmata archaeon]
MYSPPAITTYSSSFILPSSTAFFHKVDPTIYLRGRNDTESRGSVLANFIVLWKCLRVSKGAPSIKVPAVKKPIL